MSYDLNLELRKRNAVIQALNTRQTTKKKKSKANWFEKTIDTIGDLNGQVISGFVKGLEGIYDAGASVVGAVGGVFSDDFQDSVKDHIAYDFTGKNVTTHFNDWFSDSYLNDMGKVGDFIQNVASGVGQMLPAVAMNVVVPGSGLVVTGISATGNASESAFKDGAGYGKGLLYGVTSGATEMVTEKLGSKLFGNTTIDDALGLKPTTNTLFKGAKTGAGKVIQEAISEGAEEATAELANPLSKMIYKGTKSLEDYRNKEYWEGVGESALVGAGTSFAFGGTVGQINRNTNKANETLHELKTLDIKEENLHASNELFEGGNQQKIDNLRNELRTELSESVQKMNERTRAKYIEQNKLTSILNLDGSLKVETNSTQDVKTTLTDAKNGLASDIDGRYYSVGLRGQEQNIVEGLKSQGVKVFNGQLNNVEQTNYNRFKKAHLALSRKGLVRSNFVISEQSSKFDAYLDGNTTVFGKQVFESDAWQKKLIHEIEHFTEGSKEWVDFAEFVLNETNVTTANEDILSKDYGITQKDIDSLQDSLKNNSLSDKQRLYLSELMATQSEFLFGNEQYIERLTASKRNIAQKIYDKIKDFIKVLKAKTPDEKNLIQKLQKAESLFEKALSKAGTDYLIKQSIDTNKNFDYNNETKFAKQVERQKPVEHLFTAQDNEVLRERVIKKNSENTGLFPIDFDRTANHFVVYYNYGYDSYKIIKTFDIEIYYNILNELEENIKNGKIYRNSKDIRTDISRFRAEKRRSGSGDDFIKRGRSDGNDGRLHREQPKNQGIRSIGTSSFDKQKVKYVDSAKDNGDIRVGVRKRITISNNDRRKRYIDNINKESYEKHYGNRTIFERLGVKLDNDSGSHVGRKLGESLSINKGQTSNNEERISNEDGNRRGRINSLLNQHSTNWGDGYSIDNIDVSEYNLISIVDDSNINKFDKLLTNVENIVKNKDISNAEKTRVRLSLFETLQQQERRVYSKLVEINKALDDTQDAFLNDNNINIRKEFIKNLGYNGVYIQPNSKTNFDSVVYDINVKKVNLLDYSPDRAKARLDKAIKLFGETKDPKKAGWLLADGRFVDYNRDSSNILSESEDFVLDYQDHYQIEKVYDSKRGTDAIDAFMAEGNIRLMPEAGGIEVRNRPNFEQQLQLIKYIDSIIDDKGITLDLRPVNSTENTMPNYVFYDSTTDAKTIIRDINAFYNTGRVAKTVNGIKFSLSQENGAQPLTQEQLWAKLTKKDQALLYKGIDEIYHQGYYEYQLDNGDYLIDIDNKIIITDGDFQKPSIEGIIEFYKHSNKISEARDNLYEKITNGRPIWESIAFINTMHQEEVAIFYGRENSKYDSESRKQREYYFEDREIDSNRERNRISRQIKYSLTRGQVAKDRANNSKMKVYSKIEAEKLINEIVAEKLNIGDKFGTLKGKSKADAINQMFVALNSVSAGYRTEIAQNIADYIIENAIYEDIYDDGTSEETLYRYNTIKKYRGKLDLSPIKGEIQNKYDTKPGNAIIMQWGATKEGQGVDTVVQELQELGIQIDANNEADIFFEMLEIYNNARDSLNKKSQKIRADYFNSGEVKTLKNELVRDILKGYDKYGTESKFSNLIKKYVDRIELLKETIKDLKGRNKAINSLFATIDRVNGLEKFKSADIKLSNEVLGLIKLLKGVKTYRNNLSKNVREIMLKYSQDVDGRKLYELIANNGDGLENPVAKMVEDIAHGNGELTTNEIRQLDDIMKNFIHNVKEYNRVFFEGKTQNDETIVKQAILETREAVALKNKGALGAMSKFTRWLTAPVWRFERLSSYRQDGIMSKIFTELQKGVDNQARFNMVVAEHFKNFFKENKKIISDWNKQTFDLNGTKISRGQAITLYMLFQRKQAVGHLLSNDGITGTIRVANEKHASKGNFKDALAEGIDVQIDYSTVDKIKESLSDVEKEFIELSKEFFDKISKDAKYETDMALYGISNVGEENYIPIRVADDQIYKQLGGNQISFSELFSVYNASFNKETKPNAKNKIVVENILDVINRHSKQMASYYGLAVPLKTLNRLYNKKLDDGSKLSIEINKVDPEFERYLNKLLGDLQGRGNPHTTFDKVVGKIRSLGAKAALGLNLKVLANQFVSLPASHAVGVGYKNIMKGFAQATAKKTDFNKLTEYCPMLYDRFREGSNIDVGLLKENQGVFGKIDTLTELTTAPIGKVDKFICGAVWNACLEQTKSNKYEDYSDEHYKEAAKLTEKAVIKTQSNYTALYRPAILREQNSFLQLSTMFMSEPLQQLSLLTSSIDKIYVAKKLIKQNNSAENQALLKQARAEARTAITAVMVDAILLALIAQAFKWVKGQDEEETVLEGITSELTSNFVGMLPFVKDVYSLLEGYDVTNMAYTGLTNVVNGFKEIWNIVDLVASGKHYTESEIRGKVRKVLIGLSQTFGIPLRNLETYTKGIIEKFSPSFVYMWEDKLNISSGNYMKDLQTAIDNGDDKLADTIINVMLKERDVEITDKKVRTTMKSLYEEGFNVFPRTISKTIIHNGESIELTKRQHTKFTQIYSQANDKISSLINGKSFEDMPSVVKAKSIKYIYDYYYEEALKDLLGIDSDAKKYLFAQAIDITKLAMIVSQVSQIETDLDNDGKVISGSRKAKITSLVNAMSLTATQKYMLMGYFGYKNTKGERQVKLYIQSLKLTKTEKETLYSMCGY